MKKILFAFLTAGVLPFCSGTANCGAPEWEHNPFYGLDPGAVIVVKGLSEFKPAPDISRAVAYAHAIRNICGVLSSQRMGEVKKIYGSDDAVSRPEQFMTEATGNFSDCPLGTGIFKDYRASDESVTSSVFKTRKFDDENLRVLIEEHEDGAAKIFSVRAVIPASSVAYLDFTRKYGSSEAEIKGYLLSGRAGPEVPASSASVKPGTGAPPAPRASSASLIAEFKKLRAAMARDGEELKKNLGGRFKVWKGGNIKVYMQEIQGDGKVESELVVEDADAKVSWVEHLAAGVLTRGEQESNFNYNPHKGWLAVERE